MKEMSVAMAYALARQAASQLDGRNGDPLANSNWMRERALAHVVIQFVERSRRDLEVPS